MFRSQDPSPCLTSLHPAPLHQPTLGPFTPPRVLTLRFVGPKAPLSPDQCFYTEVDSISGASLPLCLAQLCSRQSCSVCAASECFWPWGRFLSCKMEMKVRALQDGDFNPTAQTHHAPHLHCHFPRLLFHCGGSNPAIALQPHG